MPKRLLVAVLACLLALSATAYAAKSVSMGDNWYVRSSGVPTVTVSKYTTVKWRNVGKSPHNVVVTKGPVKFRSSPVQAGRSWSKKVTRKGTYTIVCTIHGASDQKMKLVVR